jgi:hypothetical protein
METETYVTPGHPTAAGSNGADCNCGECLHMRSEIAKARTQLAEAERMVEFLKGGGRGRYVVKYMDNARQAKDRLERLLAGFDDEAE